MAQGEGAHLAGQRRGLDGLLAAADPEVIARPGRAAAHAEGRQHGLLGEHGQPAAATWMRTSRVSPRPPRQRPGPPESSRSAVRSMRTG